MRFVISYFYVIGKCFDSGRNVSAVSMSTSIRNASVNGDGSVHEDRDTSHGMY